MYGGVDKEIWAKTDVGCTIKKDPSDMVISWTKINERTIAIRIKLEADQILTIIIVFGPNERYCYERKPYAVLIRPLWVLVCTALMGDSSSVTATGRRSLKKSLGAPDKSRSGDRGVSRRTEWLFKWETPSGTGSEVRTMEK
ncbi:hypothetical protein Zmor_007185 [Zophobas morio]|uniref:Uncharacterized protein n=1 Tax=Zophobas morio TaxID=2755281 RepID=A0AA38ITD5_9CUCU|nr:hypothetical protein Zmor_007185 [Zophobas morio]